MARLDLRSHELGALDPLAAPRSNGTEVTTRVDAGRETAARRPLSVRASAGPTCAWLLGAGVLLAPAAAPAADPPPAAAPPPMSAPWPPPAPPGCLPSPAPYYLPLHPPKRRWYGWQTLIAAGGFITLAGFTLPNLLATNEDRYVATAGVALSAAGFTLSGPIVHWSHGHVGRGFAVLGLYVGSTLVSMGTGVGIACIAGGCAHMYDVTPGWVYGAAAGAATGALAAFVVDVAALSYDLEPGVRTGRVAGAVIPIVDVRRDRAVIGLGGAF